MNSVAERIRLMRELGRLDEAEGAARIALAHDPHDAAVLTELAVVLFHAHRNLDGLAAADAAVAADPDAEWAHRLRAVLLSRLGRHDQAVAASDAALTPRPGDPHALLCRATVLRCAGRNTEARTAAQQAVRAGPEIAAAHLELGLTCSELNEPISARKAYQETLRLEPDNVTARHNLALIDVTSLGRRLIGLRGLLDATAMDPVSALGVPAIAWVLRVLAERQRQLLLIAAAAAVAGSWNPGSADRVFAAVGLVANLVLLGWTIGGLRRAKLRTVAAIVRNDARATLTWIGLLSGIGVLAVIAATGNDPLAYGLALVQFVPVTRTVLRLRAVIGRHRRPGIHAGWGSDAPDEADAVLAAVTPESAHRPGSDPAQRSGSDSAHQPGPAHDPAVTDAMDYARMLQRTGQGAKAVSTARRLTEIVPNSVEARLAFAQIALSQRDRRTARRAYSDALRTNPGHRGAVEGLADLDRRTNRLNAALRRVAGSDVTDTRSPLVADVLVRTFAWALGVMALPGPLAVRLCTHNPDAPTPAVRVASGLILTICAVICLWPMRGVCRRMAPAAWAALRTEKRTRPVAVGMTICLLGYLTMVVTGLAWPTMLLLPSIAPITVWSLSGYGRRPPG